MQDLANDLNSFSFLYFLQELVRLQFQKGLLRMGQPFSMFPLAFQLLPGCLYNVPVSAGIETGETIDGPVFPAVVL